MSQFNRSNKEQAMTPDFIASNFDEFMLAFAR